MRQKIVITDTSILIDLIKQELAWTLFTSGIFDFKTTDFVFEELYEEQKLVLTPFIQSGQLIILTSESFDLLEISQLKSMVPALSIQDCSTWYFAKKLGGMLLTGDNTLRAQAINSGIEAHGILFILDQMISNELLSIANVLTTLTALYQDNNWLPQKEVEKRLNNWRKMLK